MNKYQKALNKLTKNVLKLDESYDCLTMSFSEIRSFYKRIFKKEGIDSILKCNKNVLERLRHLHAIEQLVNAGKGFSNESDS